ncbi:glycosyltransferase family 4 protein [Ruminiclostridium herbifermentans]|uniref:Glycosyltransferase family 4 protein n=1 Tax=Ruminiclostridium herbifermentans TaxID=2488810 RepID=A0A4U7JJ35_9FIRM|nr:glycosyltransferase family 4 protein [Ruminiclostridium herbifermentans]QNU68525.1 glycosyltransferase family 4 protein [Ruminiclostridium herbifermentans]
MEIAILINEFPPNIRSGIGRYAETGIKYINQVDNTSMSVFTTNTGYLPQHQDVNGILVYRPMNFIQKILMRYREKIESSLLSRLLLFINAFINNFQFYRFIKKRHHNKAFDVIVLHSLIYSITGFLCARRLGIPVVFHKHREEFARMPDWWRRDPFKLIELSESAMEKLAAKIIVLTEEMYAENLRYGICPEKLMIISNGCEVDLFKQVDLNCSSTKQKMTELKKELNIADDRKVILYVGSLTEGKGVFNLIRAVKILINNGHKVKLVLVGSGRNAKVRALINNYGLQKDIYAYYKIIDINSLIYHYAIADVCIFPSITKEPFGTTVTEAMSFGKLVILGYGYSKLFAEYENKPCAFYVDGNQPGKIGAKIAYVLDNKDRFQEVAQNGQRYIQNCFKWETAAKKTVVAYNEAISSNENLMASNL